MVHNEDGDDAPVGNYFYAYNGSGSVCQIFDSTGDIEHNYDYEAFGADQTGPGEGLYNRFRFLGGEIEADTVTQYSEGLYHFNGSIYDPSTGIHYNGNLFITKGSMKGDINTKNGNLDREVEKLEKVAGKKDDDDSQKKSKLGKQKKEKSDDVNEAQSDMNAKWTSYVKYLEKPRVCEVTRKSKAKDYLEAYLKYKLLLAQLQLLTNRIFQKHTIITDIKTLQKKLSKLKATIDGLEGRNVPEDIIEEYNRLLKELEEKKKIYEDAQTALIEQAINDLIDEKIAKMKELDLLKETGDKDKDKEVEDKIREEYREELEEEFARFENAYKVHED